MAPRSLSLLGGLFAAAQGLREDLLADLRVPRDFCGNGLPKPNFREDHGSPSVEVFLASAPFGSMNAVVGNKLGLMGLYTTALVFRQRRTITNTDHYWTLRFDYSKGSFISGAIPTIVGGRLEWDSDARYCLTDGLLYGKEHWTKDFDSVFNVTKEQAERTFSELIQPLNSSAHGAFPQYQLWRVVKSPGLKLPSKGLEGAFRKQEVMSVNTMLQDVTGPDGLKWVLHHLTTLGARPHDGFQFRGTSLWLNANSIEPVDRADHDAWEKMVAYFKIQHTLLGNASTIVDKSIIAITNFFPMQYVHNANTDTYFKVSGNIAPFFRIEHVPVALAGPPTLPERKEKLNAEELISRNEARLIFLESLNATEGQIAAQKAIKDTAIATHKAMKNTEEATRKAASAALNGTKSVLHKISVATMNVTSNIVDKIKERHDDPDKADWKAYESHMARQERQIAAYNARVAALERKANRTEDAPKKQLKVAAHERKAHQTEAAPKKQLKVRRRW